MKNIIENISTYNAAVLSTDTTADERAAMFDAIMEEVKKANKAIFDAAHAVSIADAIANPTYTRYTVKTDDAGVATLAKSTRVVELFRIAKRIETAKRGKGAKEVTRLYTIAMHRFCGACLVDLGADAEKPMEVHAENLYVQEGKRAADPYSNNSLSDAVAAIMREMDIAGALNGHYIRFVKQGCASISSSKAGTIDEKRLSSFARVLDSMIIKCANGEKIEVGKMCADMPKVEEKNAK